MAGYADTRQMIIDTLMGRMAGTEIQPEDHQKFALQITDYVRSVELVAGNASPIGFADADTVPVQPDNGQAVYLSSVGGAQTVTFSNFIGQNGSPISVTSTENVIKLVTLLWNGQYWSSQVTSVNAVRDTTNGYLFIGIATPDTDPGEPDQKVFYIASIPGKYSNFGDVTVDGNEAVVFYYDTEWHVKKTGISTIQSVENVNDIYMNIQEDGVGYYQNDISIGINPEWRYKHLTTSNLVGKRIRFRAGDTLLSSRKTVHCYAKLSDNSIVSLSIYVIDHKENFDFIKLASQVTDIYISWDAESEYKSLPMIAIEPLDDDFVNLKNNVERNFTCGVTSSDNRYENCILSFAFGVENSAIGHDFALSMFGWNSQNTSFYLGVFDITANERVGYTLFPMASVPTGGIEHYKFFISGVNVNYSVDPYFDIVIDWSKYEQSMLYLNDNTKVLLSYRGSNDIVPLWNKTIKNGLYFDLFNNARVGQYYKSDLTLGAEPNWQAKSFNVSEFVNRVLFFRCGYYSSGAFVKYCYFETTNSSIIPVDNCVVFNAVDGAFVLVPSNAQTLYISFGFDSRLFGEPCLCYDEAFNSILYNYFSRGYITNKQKYQSCILAISYDYSPTSLAVLYPFSVLYFGINPDNMRFYIGFFDLTNNKRVGYFIFPQVFQSIPTSGIQIFEVETLNGHNTDAFTFTNVKIVVDWSKYEQSMYFINGDTEPSIFLSTIGCGKATTDIYSKLEKVKNSENAFDIVGGNYPVLPSQLFLQSDKSIPIYKNSLLLNPSQASKIDINLIANQNESFSRKIFEIKEPSYFNNDDFSVAGKFFLQRTNDLQNFYYKDVTIFHKDVSSVSGKTIKIMSLGDSLTQGRNWYDTPITMLAQDLLQYGVTLQYVGTLVRSYVNNIGVSTQIRYEGRGAWRYRTFVGMESKFADLDVVIPSATQHEWIEGVDGDMNTIKANNAWLYPATAQDLNDNPDFCFHFVSGSTVANKSYSEDATLGSYVIFDPVRYFSQRNIDIPDIVTIALGTNEWYLGPGQYGGFNNEKATKCAEFMIKQFRKVSENLKIVVIPMNNFPVTRQSDWQQYCMPLCSNVIKICDNLIKNGDNKLFICPIYAQGSRGLGFNGTIGVSSDVSDINDMQKIEMDDNVHMLYERDDSNEDYRNSLLACVLNLID